jgi:hypothetical protein
MATVIKDPTTRIGSLTAPNRVAVYDVPVTFAHAAVLESYLWGITCGGSPVDLLQVSRTTLKALTKAPKTRSMLSSYRDVFPIGPAFSLLSRFRGLPLCPDDAVVVGMMLQARERAESVFLLHDDRQAVFDRARLLLRSIPGLRLAGAHAPELDFRDREGALRLVERINRSKADILLTLPKSERVFRFPQKYRGALQTRVHLTVAGGDPFTRDSGGFRPQSRR